MRQLVAVLGRGIVPTSDGLGTADDAGLVRGDGCFDATLLRDGHPFDLDEHLGRFARSCELMSLPAPDEAAWRSLINDAITVWDGPEAALKIVCTRGPEHGGDATNFLSITAIADAVRAQRDGVSAVTLCRGYASGAFADAPWLLGGTKTLSYAVNTAAKREATRRGADDVVFTSTDGYLLEAPTAAIVWRVGDVLFSTPHGPTGILESISQRKIFATAPSAGLGADFALGTPGEVLASDGAWLVSSVRGVAPILTLDGTPMRHDPDTTVLIRSLNGF